MPNFSKPPFIFHLIFLDNTSLKFWIQSLSPHYQCCLQISGTVSSHKLWCCYSVNRMQHWVGARGLIYFCRIDHSRISINFSRNWLRLNNLCKILLLNVGLRGSSQTPGITKGNLGVHILRSQKIYASTDSEHKFHKTVMENWLLIGFKLGDLAGNPQL